MSEFEDRVREYALKEGVFGGTTPGDVFHNWILRLPGSAERIRQENDEFGEIRIPGHRQGKTYNEFANDVDQALMDAGIDLERVVTMQEDMNRLALEGEIEEEDKVWLELMELTFPALMKLRDVGYTDHDLTG